MRVNTDRGVNTDGELQVPHQKKFLTCGNKPSNSVRRCTFGSSAVLILQDSVPLYCRSIHVQSNNPYFRFVF